jgi:ketosteroid isomerase-like protein
MPEEPTTPDLEEAVRRAFEAFNRGDFEAVLPDFDPNVELVAPPQWPDDRVGWGHDGVRNVMVAWTRQFDDFRIDPSRMIDAGGDRIVVLSTQRGRIKGSDSWVEHRVGVLHELRDGKITRWRAYLSWEEALDAAGLAE